MLYPFPLKSSISQTETWVGRFIDFHFLTAKDAKIRSKGNKAFLNHRGTETQSKTKQIFFLSFFPQLRTLSIDEAEVDPPPRTSFLHRIG